MYNFNINFNIVTFTIHVPYMSQLRRNTCATHNILIPNKNQIENVQNGFKSIGKKVEQVNMSIRDAAGGKTLKIMFHREWQRREAMLGEFGKMLMARL